MSQVEQWYYTYKRKIDVKTTRTAENRIKLTDETYWFFTGVGADVFGQHGFQSKCFVAVFTHVWFHIGMERHVTVQITSKLKDSSALVANVITGNRHVLSLLVVSQLTLCCNIQIRTIIMLCQKKGRTEE